jgi:hypothetical protein
MAIAASIENSARIMAVKHQSTTAQLSAPESKHTFGWVDLAVLPGLFGLLWSVLHFGRGMVVNFDEKSLPPASFRRGAVAPDATRLFTKDCRFL